MADDEISTLYADRASVYASLVGAWDDLVMVYHGILPSEFDDFFHEEMHRHVVNMIRLSWDDLAAMAGKVFPIYVDPDNDTPKAKARAEKQEQIGYGYNEAGKIVGGIEMPMLMKILAWWMVGIGEAVPMVLPNYQKHTPYFTFRDPRTYYPPIGWTPFSQAPADDALFVTQMSLGELKRRYPDRATELDQKLGRSISSRVAITTTTDSSQVLVGEYYHQDTWLTQTIADVVVNLDRHDHDMPDFPGVVPVEPMSLYSAGPRARSLFSDQISLQAAMARMFSQKLDFYDRTLYPLIFTAPLAQKAVQVGPWAINEFDPTFQGQFKVEVVGPTNAIDADQSMAFVMGMQRMLNRNPESFQGQAPGGRAESAKAINSLRDAVANTTIRDMLWPPMLHALPKLYEKAARMDVNLWPNEEKKASGRSKNDKFRINYRPKVDLQGRRIQLPDRARRGARRLPGDARDHPARRRRAHGRPDRPRAARGCPRRHRGQAPDRRDAAREARARRPRRAGAGASGEPGQAPTGRHRQAAPARAGEGEGSVRRDRGARRERAADRGAAAGTGDAAGDAGGRRSRARDGPAARAAPGR